MGEKRRRLKEFLSNHPICCFCGGKELATTQDHLPPRSVFDQKKWPIGYIFPACEKCNSGSSKYDSIFALISRINPFKKEPEDVQKETEKLILAYVEQFPEEAVELKLSSNAKRKWAKKSNFKLGRGETYGELPIIRIPKSWNDSIHTVSTKLIKALHYKHTGQIIPTEGRVEVKWWSNAEYIEGNFPKEFVEQLGGHVLLKRDKLTLNEQFSYSYQVSEDGKLGMYGAYFRFSFYVAGIVYFDPKLFEKTNS